MDYIHFNPVKHGWANRVMDWPHSSFHHYVRQGILSPDRGIGAMKGNMGNDYYIPDSATVHPGYAGCHTR